MAIPAPKSKMMEDMLEKISHELYGKSRILCIQDDVCICCSKSTKNVTGIDLTEFTISGLCPECFKGDTE